MGMGSRLGMGSGKIDDGEGRASAMLVGSIGPD